MKPNSPERSPSPIQIYTKSKTLNNSKMYGSTVSNKQVPNFHEVDLWRSRCNDLETSLCKLHTDLEIANLKALQAQSFDSQIDELYKQNKKLLEENQALNKELSVKKTEITVLKTKFEQASNGLIQQKSTYEFEIAQLKIELQQVRESTELQRENFSLRQSQVIPEGQSQLQIEKIKRSHQETVILLEDQLRKLRQIVVDREKENQQLQRKVIELKNDENDEFNRLLQERENLRVSLSKCELEYQTNLEFQKRKLEDQMQEKQNSLQKLYQNKQEILDSEIMKLKGLLELKNQEIQLLINQNASLQENYESENLRLRKEIEQLKNQQFQNNICKEDELEDYKQRFIVLHQNDVQNLKILHQNQLDALDLENRKQSDIIRHKSKEIEELIKEKNLLRENYNQEVDYLKKDIVQQQLRIREYENDKQRSSEINYMEQEKLHKLNFEMQQKTQLQLNIQQSEIDKLKMQLDLKQEETYQLNDQLSSTGLQLENEIQFQKQENLVIKERYQKLIFEKEKLNDDLQQKFAEIEQQLLDQLKKSEDHIDYLESEIIKSRDSQSNACEDYSRTSIQINLLETSNKKLKTEVECLSQHLEMLEKLKLKEINDLKAKLELSNAHSIEQLKTNYQQQVNMLMDEINDLKSSLYNKDREIIDLSQKKEKIETALSEYKANSGKLKDYEKRIAKLGSEIVNTKSMYDALKGKN